jgi:hypothetical protein
MNLLGTSSTVIHAGPKEVHFRLVTLFHCTAGPNEVHFRLVTLCFTVLLVPKEVHFRLVTLCFTVLLENSFSLLDILAHLYIDVQ